MSLNDDPVAALERSLDQLNEICSGVAPEQLSMRTPCSSWDVRTVAGHVLQGARNYAQAAGAGTVSSTRFDDIGEGWRTDVREAADALMAAWREPGSLDRTISTLMGEVPATFRLRQQVTEFTLHGWDLAHATGQDDRLDPALVEVALGFGHASLKPQFRGSEADGMAFGPEVEAPADATEYERLAAFFGRDPRAPRVPAR